MPRPAMPLAPPDIIPGAAYTASEDAAYDALIGCTWPSFTEEHAAQMRETAAAIEHLNYLKWLRS